MKYIDWLIQWLENYIRPSVKVRTYERYRLIIEQHIRNKIGSMELNDLSPLVRAGVRAPAVPPRTHPCDIRVFIAALHAAERPAAFPALNEGRKQIAVALPLVVYLEGLSARFENILHSVKLFRIDDAKVGSLDDEPFGRIFLLPLPRQKVGNLLLAVDDLTRIKLVCENAHDRIGRPRAISFGADTPFVEHNGYFCCAEALLLIPCKDLPHRYGLALVDLHVEVFSGNLVVPEYDIRHSALFGIDPLAELDALGRVSALLLRERPENCEYEFAVAHARHVRRQKLRFDAKRFEPADILQKVDGIARKSGNILDDNHIEKPRIRISHHLLKFFAVFNLCARKPLIGI